MQVLSSGGELEFRYRFTVQDDEFAYRCSDRSKRIKTARLVLPTLLLVGLIGVLSCLMFLAGVRTASVATALICAFLLGYALRQIVELKPWAKTYVEKFDPIEIVSNVFKEGISNRTPYVEELVRWQAVQSIVCRDYGIVFKSNRTQWYIPKSAFENTIEMHKAHKQVVKLQAQYSG